MLVMQRLDCDLSSSSVKRFSRRNEKLLIGLGGRNAFRAARTFEHKGRGEADW